MTRKQDLIQEAKILGIAISNKDTIPVLYKKINLARINSNRTICDPKAYSTKSKIVADQVIFNFLQNRESIKITFESKELNIQKIFNIVDHFKYLKDENYIIRDENDSEIEIDSILKGGIYTIKEEVVHNPIQKNISGIDEYMKMPKLEFLGLNDKMFNTRKSRGGGTRSIDLFFLKKDYYMLSLILQVPFGMDTSSEGNCVKFNTKFSKITCKQFEEFYNSPFGDKFKNETRNSIIFNGYKKKANFKIHYDKEELDSFFEFPKFIKELELKPNGI